MNGSQGEPINLDRHFQNMEIDWEAEPLPPLWLPKKILRNKEAHAFPYTGFIGMGTGCSYIALCGWRPDEKYNFRKRAANFKPEGFFEDMPASNVCEKCIGYAKIYEQKRSSFSHSNKASDIRSSYVSSGIYAKDIQNLVDEVKNLKD